MRVNRSCSNHPDRTAGWYCWNCGLPFCEECVEPWNEQYLCGACREEFQDDASQIGNYTGSWPENRRDAGIATRLLAFFLDFTILIVLTMVLTWLLHHLLYLPADRSRHLFWPLFYAGLLFRDAFYPGGSPGKRWTGLYVWNRSRNRPVSGIDSIVRNLLFPVFLLDVIVIPFTRNRQRLGDLLAGTVVCDEQSRREGMKELYRLGIVVLLNLGLIFSLYIFWLNAQMHQRSLVFQTISQQDVSQDNIVTVLQQESNHLPRFNVEKTADGIIILAESPTAEEYYRIRKQFKDLLQRASYEIVEESDPELVFRGRGSVYFQWEIHAKSLERTD